MNIPYANIRCYSNQEHPDTQNFADDFEKYSGNWTVEGKLFTKRSYASAQTVEGTY